MGKVIQWEMCNKLNFDHTNKLYMHNPESVQENETRKLHWDFEIQTDHLISTRRPDLTIIYKKERTCRIGNFAVPVVYRIKLKKPWTMKALAAVTKGLVQGLEDLEMTGLVETVQTTALLRSAKTLRVLDTWGDLLSLKFQWKIIS